MLSDSGPAGAHNFSAREFPETFFKALPYADPRCLAEGSMVISGYWNPREPQSGDPERRVLSSHPGVAREHRRAHGRTGNQ